MKPGWFTSEAHMTAFVQLLAAIATFAGAFQNGSPDGVRVAMISVGALASVVSSWLYGKQRTELKAAALPPFFASSPSDRPTVKP